MSLNASEWSERSTASGFRYLLYVFRKGISPWALVLMSSSLVRRSTAPMQRYSRLLLSYVWLWPRRSFGENAPVLVYLAIRLWRDQSKKWARTLFWYSNMYLAALFAIMVLDQVIH